MAEAQETAETAGAAASKKPAVLGKNVLLAMSDRMHNDLAAHAAHHGGR